MYALFVLSVYLSTASKRWLNAQESLISLNSNEQLMSFVYPAVMYPILLTLMALIGVTDVWRGKHNLTMKPPSWKGINEMDDSTILKWLGGIFAVVFVVALWLSGSGADNPECDNTQYSTQSC